MKEYPRTMTERSKIRSNMLEYYTVSGMRRGLSYGMSLRCSQGDHGCQNTGQSCLCICHDKGEEYGVK